MIDTDFSELTLSEIFSRQYEEFIPFFCSKTNIFDSMIYMMENYANNLEDIVTERTSQLIEAKRETEELLYKIFPRYCLI